jgi:serine/threonine protein phosphatase PrpC
VVDGDGSHGAEIARYSAERLARNIESSGRAMEDCVRADPDLISERIANAVTQTHEELKTHDSFNLATSGATLGAVLIAEDDLWTTLLGECRCVLGSWHDSEWICKSLNNPHLLSRRDEVVRALQTGATVFGDGCARVFNQAGTHALSVSRCLGHLDFQSVGVIDRPEVEHHTLHIADRFLILASDGLWRVISGERVVEIVSRFYENQDGATAAARSLVLVWND